MSVAELGSPVEPTVDLAAGVVRRGPLRVQLEPRALELLRYLSSRPGGLITKQQVIRDIWGCQSLSDDTVWRAVAQLRTALGDDPRTPRWIETIPRRGYRLLRAPRQAAPVAGDDQRPVPRTAGRRPLAAALLALVVVAATATAIYRSSRPQAAADTTGQTVEDEVSTTLRRGLFYYQQLTPASFARAQELFVAASRMAPGDPRPASLLALTQAQLGEPAAALASARLAVGRAPGWAHAHSSLGFAFLAAGRLQAAETAYGDALAIDPTNLDTRRRACIVEQARGQLAQSIDCYRSILDQAPAGWAATAYSLTFGKLALAHYQLGDEAAAVSAALAARRYDPADRDSAVVLASLRGRSGDVAGARAVMQELDQVAVGDGTFAAVTIEHLWGDASLAAAAAEQHLRGGAAGVYAPELLANAKIRLASALARSDRERSLALAGELAVELRARLAAGSERYQDALYLAAAESLLGRTEAAMNHLTQAVELGYIYPLELERDPILDGLRRQPGFVVIRTTVTRRTDEERRRLAAIAATANPT